MQKFKAGDRVRIIGYGHPIYHSKKYYKDGPDIDKPDNIIREEEKGWWVDMSPEEVGQEAIVEGSYTDLYGGEPREKATYSLIRNNGGKCAWFEEEQLELIVIMGESKVPIKKDTLISVLKEIRDELKVMNKNTVLETFNREYRGE